MSRKKVFVLGLDGATFDLIGPWVAEGKLPSFSRVMAEGVWSEMESVPNQRSAAAWTTFITGKNPGKHGIFEFYEYQPKSYSVSFINARQRQGKSLWNILSQKGRTVGVMNVPMTYPAEAVNGFVIGGLDSPSVKSKNFTFPADLYDRLRQKFGDYILEPGLTGAIVGGRVEDAIDLIKVELNQKVDIARHLMTEYSWDFFVVVLRSLDAVQHCFWKYMDSTHPDFNISESKRYGDTILNTYQLIDDFLAFLMATLDEDTTLLVMSDHGFGRKHPAANQLNQWLEHKRLLTHKGFSRKGAAGLLGILYKKVVGRTPRRVKELLWETFPQIRDRVQSRLCFTNIDWRKTMAYSDSLFPNIRINLKGREGCGIVTPGNEYEQLIQGLISDLKGIRDVKTGESIVDEVFRKEDIYHGRHVEKAPDILIRWREDVDISGIKLDGAKRQLDPTIPLVPGEDYRVISGDHHLKGILLARGKDIKKGIRVDQTTIADLAPTILYQMGVPVPDDMDGKVLKSIFKDSFLQSHPVTYIQTGGTESAIDSDVSNQYTEDENTEIEKRLQALGYIE